MIPSGYNMAEECRGVHGVYLWRNRRGTIKSRLINDLSHRCEQSPIYRRIYLFYGNTDVLSHLRRNLLTYPLISISLWQETREILFVPFLMATQRGVLLYPRQHKVRGVVTVFKPCLNWFAIRFRSSLDQIPRAT